MEKTSTGLKKPLSYLKREDGFGPHYGGLIVWVSIAIIAAISYSSYIKQKEDIAPSIECLTNLIAIAKGKSSMGMVCPATDKPYSVTEKDGNTIYACSGSGETHLPTDPHFIKSAGGRVYFDQRLPEPPKIGGDGMLEVGERTFITAGADGVEVRVKNSFFMYIVLGIMALGALIIFSALVSLIRKKQYKDIMIAAAVVFVIGIPILVMALFIFVGVPVYSVPKWGGTMGVEQRIFRVEELNYKEITGIKAAVPMTVYKDKMKYIVFYEGEKGLEHERTFNVHPEKLGVLSIVHDALFPPKKEVFYIKPRPEKVTTQKPS